MSATRTAGPPAPGVPLFITKFSESPKTAIGVQTALLMTPFPTRRHVYWATARSYPNSASRLRLENPVLARVGRLQRPKPAGLLRTIGIGWWRDGVLRPSRRGVLRSLRREVSHLYVAPIDADDAERMRFLVEQLDRPYVLHLWDSLNGPVAADPNMCWLAEHAGGVVSLSAPLIEELEEIGVHSGTLLFTRQPSRVQAQQPPKAGEPVRIALLGVLDPYLDGVLALATAIQRLRDRGVDVDLVYIGSPKSVRRVNEHLTRSLEATGFLSAPERDACLASCHFGFLPGPMADPGSDMRSRYSIPSRALDFLAVGVPTVGTVHPASATGRFYEQLGLQDGMVCSDAEQVADAILRLMDADRWRDRQRRSTDAFADLAADPPTAQLERLMAQVAADGRRP